MASAATKSKNTEQARALAEKLVYVTNMIKEQTATMRELEKQIADAQRNLSYLLLKTQNSAIEGSNLAKEMLELSRREVALTEGESKLAQERLKLTLEKQVFAQEKLLYRAQKEQDAIKLEKTISALARTFNLAKDQVNYMKKVITSTRANPAPLAIDDTQETNPAQSQFVIKSITVRHTSKNTVTEGESRSSR